MTSQFAVIIQALAPVIGPYMSRAITTIHIQETSGSRTSRTTAGARSYRNADSTMVGGRSAGVAGPASKDETRDDDAVTPVRRRRRATRCARKTAHTVRCSCRSRLPTPSRARARGFGGARQREAIRGRMAGVVEVHRLGGIRG